MLKEKKVTPFSYNLRSIRHQFGFNQSKFAKELKVSTRTVLEYERGIRMPSLQFIERVLRFCRKNGKNRFGFNEFLGLDHDDDKTFEQYQ